MVRRDRLMRRSGRRAVFARPCPTNHRGRNCRAPNCSSSARSPPWNASFMWKQPAEWHSPLAGSYHTLWQTPLSVGVGDFVFERSLHFWVNDALMTIFFLVVGREIRREAHEGALSDPRQASLPIMAAVGGVIVPALIYTVLNTTPARIHGWAVPTATDIAFAVGVLALLGKSIPSNIRVFLLTLAIMDDIIAVIIIALFYSGGMNYEGFLVAGIGLVMVIGLQRAGIGSAYAYVLPGIIAWVGLLMTGAHPTLAGVGLGMMTPVVPMRTRERPLKMLRGATDKLANEDVMHGDDMHVNAQLRRIRLAQRELLPPAARVQMALHPWVAFGIMPLFALANAGVGLGELELSTNSLLVMSGVTAALVVGKPAGVIGMSWLMVRLGLCRLPSGVSWRGIVLIGLLAGIGFTMSIFIAMLAFSDEAMLGAAKLGVLLGSFIAALLGLSWGAFYRRTTGEE